jgi:DNA-binding CsgD family transcriptional regulator
VAALYNQTFFNKLVSTMNAQTVFDAMLHHQNQYYTAADQGVYQELLINPFASNELSVKGVIDLTTVEMVQTSDNVADVLGVPAEKAPNFTMMDFLGIVSQAHLNLVPSFVEWLYKTVTDEIVCNVTCCICGIQLPQVDKPDKWLLVQLYPYQMQPNGIPKYAIFCMNDVTHLVKGGVAWVRTALYKAQTTEIHTLTFPPQRFKVGEMLSKREQEILRYLAAGCESKEIAQKLHLSVFTVNNHRKNMIAALGARDTTAMIQLCQMSGILQRN